MRPALSQRPAVEQGGRPELERLCGVGRAERRAVALCIGVSVLFKLGLLVGLTRGVLVDDAYIHLRYARNLVEHGAFVYNLGEPVFGLTSPLFGLLAAACTALLGTGAAAGLLALNLVLWSALAWRVALRSGPGPRPFVLVLLLFWPSFVDNQLLGMESALFALLLVAAVDHAREERWRALGWTYGLALVTRPEAVLLAPFLLALAGRAHWRRLFAPGVLAGLLGPALAWIAFALPRYGSLLPQSMVAKSGWNARHYDALFGLDAALLCLPRLTWMPFVDALPVPLRWSAVVLTLALFAAVAHGLGRARLPRARTWAGFCAAYLAFFLLGKGATEASWYAIPGGVALLLASEPLWPLRGSRRTRAAALALGIACAGLSTLAALRRAPLLHHYPSTYGAAARALTERAAPDARVLVGEIGVYGDATPLRIVDAGALVSPEVLPLKNEGLSLTAILRRTDADYLVVSARALASNHYPSVGAVWADAGERTWFERSCREVLRHGDKLTFAVDPTGSRDPDGSAGEAP